MYAHNAQRMKKVPHTGVIRSNSPISLKGERLNVHSQVEGENIAMGRYKYASDDS